MSDREKELVQQIGKMPDKLQEAFLNMASGALMALDSLEEKKEETNEPDEREESA